MLKELTERIATSAAARIACRTAGFLLLLVCSAAPAPGQTELVVRVYSCPVGTAQATTEQLRGEFGVIPGVRVAADDRTSQIVVQATPEIQSRISQRLAQGVTPPPAVPPSPDSGQNPGFSQVVSLQHLTGDQMAAAVAAVVGSRLTAVSGEDPRAKHYRLALATGGAVSLRLQAAGQVTIEGPAAPVQSCARLIQALDNSGETGQRKTQVVPLQSARPASIERASAVIREATAMAGPRMPMVAMLLQPSKPPPSPPPPPAEKTEKAATAKPVEGLKEAGGLVSPVQIEMLDGLDILVLRGNRQDVDQVMEIINQIERLSAETEPAIEVLRLAQVDCQALAALVRSLYDEVYRPRQGSVSITPLVKPNALLLVGRKENVERVNELVRRLDQPVPPNTEFRVFHLRHAAASAAQATILEFYADRGGLGTLVRVTADARSNALIVQAAPRDLAEVAALIARIDVATSAAVNELRVIRLEHSMAQDMASILQSAIGAASSAPSAAAPGRPTPGGPAPSAATARPGTDQRSAILRFLTIDAKGRRMLNSGLLSDVRITADVRANALVISAPAESMELIETLVRHMDRLPAAEAQIKVFTIVNGDATSLADMLRMLFAVPATQVGMMLQTAASGGESSLVPLRFAVDSRTNSIIASGSMGDLIVVEAVLMRLDDSDVRHRKSVVFRLKNAPASDVATAINEFLRSERQVQQIGPGLTSPFEQLEREVVVVPEPVSNSLILSATPRFFDEIRALIEQLDARPPMVMIQVLIAEVSLGDTNEFGIEVGLQDGILFDRSVLSNIQTISTTVIPTGTNQPSVTTQSIVAADNTPGFNFNNLPLGNSGSTQALSRSGAVGTQGLSNFAVGRTNSALGFGGLVLSASSESVSMLLRALSECRRVDILQRPQVMTLDNQPAFIQVGQRVPRITGTQVNQIGQVNNITLENVGLILGVTPRISPDGLVVMEIDAEKSELGPEADGIPVSISATGQVIRSPRINTTTAQTTVSALSGQTVVLGGLISKTKSQLHRKVPLLGDIPLLGAAFRFDSVSSQRTELLIIMTPHIVRNEADADAIKRVEAARMNWCLADVVSVYGEAGLRRRTDQWSDSEVPTFYPDAKPSSPRGAPMPGAPERIPAPQGTPAFPPPPGVAPMPGPPAGPTLAPPVSVTQPSADQRNHREAAPGANEVRLAPVDQARYYAPYAPLPPAPPSGAPAGYPPVQPAGYAAPPPSPGGWETRPANQPAVQPVVYQQPFAPPQGPAYR